MPRMSIRRLDVVMMSMMRHQVRVRVCVNVNRRTTHRTPERTRGRGTLSHRRDAGLVAGALIDRVERVRGAHLPGGMQAEVALDGAAVRNDDRVGHAARVVDAEARGREG